MSIGIATAGGGHTWETSVVADLARPAAQLTVVRRCADIADVLAIAATGQIRACLLAAHLRRLDSELVQQLKAFGVTIVAVHRAGDQRSAALLRGIGIDNVIADDVGSAELIEALKQAGTNAGTDPLAQISTDPRSTADPRASLPLPASERSAARNDPDGSCDGAGRGDGDDFSYDDDHDHDYDCHHDDGYALALPANGERSNIDALGANAADASDADADSADNSDSPGDTGDADHRQFGASLDDEGPASAGAATEDRVTKPRHTYHVAPPDWDRITHAQTLAVWGPKGAPGRTTVAIGIANAAAQAGQSVLLIDADAYGGVLANAYGLLDESAGLAGACRLAANGRLDDAGLAKLCWAISDELTVLTGIARADRWPELRPSAIPVVLDIARQHADLVVVDCSDVLETDEEITFDTMAPRRNGATLAVLDRADVILAVGSADPPGMERLARGLVDLSEAVAGARTEVILNRVRAGAAAPDELTQATRRFCATAPLALLPEDRAACDLAWRRGVSLPEAAPKSPLTKAFATLAANWAPARPSRGRSMHAASSSMAESPA